VKYSEGQKSVLSMKNSTEPTQTTSEGISRSKISSRLINQRPNERFVGEEANRIVEPVK
jgi:hypothetical protein